MALHCTKTFIITLPLSQYDVNIVVRDVKHQIIIIILDAGVCKFHISSYSLMNFGININV